MSTSPIDALSLITPARAAVAPSRGVREQAAFGPALEQAYGSDKTREAAAPVELHDAPAEAAEGEDDVALESSAPADERSETADDDGDIVPVSDEADEASELDEDRSADEVEISETAGAAALAKDSQTALHAEKIAAQRLGETPVEAATAEATEAVPTDAGVAGGTSPTSGDKKNGSLSHRGDESATDGASPAKSAKGTKRTGDVVEGLAASAADETAADSPANERRQVEETKPPVEETEQSEGELSKDEKRGQPQTTKLDGNEPFRISSAEQSAELAASVERQVTLIDQSSPADGGAEVAATPPVEAASGGTTSQRAAATLDRLAAASLRRSDEAGSADGGPPIDRPRFVQRVEGALRAAQQRDGRVQVRLAPPELGVVHIELLVQNGVMTAKLEAETSAARNALLDNLPALRERLAEQNIRVDKFDVDVRRDSQGGGSNNETHDRRGDHGEPGPQGRRGRPATTPATAPPASRAARTAISASDAGLDVRI